MQRRGVILAAAALLTALMTLAWSPAPYRFYGERNRRLAEIAVLWREREASQVSLLIYLRSWLDSKIAEVASLGLNPYCELSRIPAERWVSEYSRWLSRLPVDSRLNASLRASPYSGQRLDSQQLNAMSGLGQLGGVYVEGWLKGYLEATSAYTRLDADIRVAHPVRIYMLYHMSEAAKAAAEEAVRARLDYGRRAGAKVIAYRYSRLYEQLLEAELRRVPWPLRESSLEVRYVVSVEVRYYHRYYDDYLGLGPATRVTKVVSVEIAVLERKACDRSPHSKVFTGRELSSVEYSGGAWRTGVFVYVRSWIERGHVRYSGSSFRLERKLALNF